MCEGNYTINSQFLKVQVKSRDQSDSFVIRSIKYHWGIEMGGGERDYFSQFFLFFLIILRLYFQVHCCVLARLGGAAVKKVVGSIRGPL